METEAAAGTAARARAEAIEGALAPKKTANAETEAEQAPSDRMVELGLGQAACAAKAQATAATVQAAAGEPVAFLLGREAKVVQAAEKCKNDAFADTGAVQVTDVPLPAPFSQGNSGAGDRRSCSACCRAQVE